MTKIQLFAGASLVERQRLDLAFARAGAIPGGAETDSLAELAIVPADVLIAGSVGVQPAEGATRIKVLARAVETATGKVMSQAAFSGQSDLAGLLGIVEKLAAALAQGLGLTYTPAQLAYAEPAGLDTLQRFVEGRARLREGRHREAIDAFTEALENNGGRYFAAAHRALGEAYQARIEAQQAADAGKTRQEYLERFRRDALQAAGALFDLAVAYAANGFWREGSDTFRDYIAAVGSEGETVRWTFEMARDLVGAALPPGISGRELGAFFSWTTAFKLRDGRLRFLHGERNGYEVEIDAATGKLAGVAPVTDPAVAEELKVRRDATPAVPPPSYKGAKGYDLPLLARTDRLLLYLESPVLVLVDAATGEPVAKYRTEEVVLGGLFVPNAPRRIFAGREESVYDADTRQHKAFWFYSPESDPALNLAALRESRWGSLLRRLPERLPAAARAALAAVLVAPSIAYARPAYSASRLRSSAVYRHGVEDAVELLKRSNVRGNILNEYAMGGYLAWRLHPEMKVFIYGRMIFPELLTLSDDVVLRPGKSVSLTSSGSLSYFYRTVLDGYAVDAVILPPGDLRSGDVNSLCLALVFDDAWALVYAQPKALLFLRKTPAVASLVGHALPKALSTTTSSPLPRDSPPRGTAAHPRPGSAPWPSPTTGRA